MSFRVLQLSPLTSTEGTQMRIAIQGPWSSPPGLSDTQFLRSWLVYDSELEDGEPRSRIHVALGMLLFISVGFWTGVGVLVAQIWK